MDWKRFAFESDAATESKFQSLDAATKAVREWREEGSEIAKKALIFGLMFLAYSETVKWMKGVEGRRDRIQVLEQTLSAAQEGVVVAVKRLGDREEIPVEVFNYVKKTVYCAIVDDYRKQLLTGLTSKELERLQQKYDEAYFKVNGHYPPEPQTLYVAHFSTLESNETWEAEFIPDRTESVFGYIARLTETEWEYELLSALIDRLDKRFNVLERMREMFPGTTQRQIQDAKAVFKERVAELLQMSVAAIERHRISPQVSEQIQRAIAA